VSRTGNEWAQKGVNLYSRRLEYEGGGGGGGSDGDEGFRKSTIISEVHNTSILTAVNIVTSQCCMMGVIIINISMCHVKKIRVKIKNNAYVQKLSSLALTTHISNKMSSLKSKKLVTVNGRDWEEGALYEE
jgi:hypothetical protein